MLKKFTIQMCMGLILVFIIAVLPLHAQNFVEDYTTFGQNKVQYKDFVWYYIQSDHFDVYFYEDGERLAEFVADVAEASLKSLENSLQYRMKERVPLVVYKSHNDFQQTNVVQEYMEEGIGGVTESFKNRVVFPFEGDYAQFRHVIHHELTHAFMNDMMFGGGITNAVLNQARYNIPLWFAEGLAEFESMGWDTRADMMMRDAIITGYLRPEYLDVSIMAYWGGENIFNFIKEKYGEEKVGELVRKLKQTRDINRALKAAIGMDFEEMLKKWELHEKRVYWPDIKNRQEPQELAKALTDHEKAKNYTNISPSISPNGDKIAFISDRDGYNDVFIMSAIDGKILDKLISGQKSPQFEELHWLQPGISWSPDGKYIALAAKGKGAHDVLYTIEIETKKIKSFVFDLDGAFGSSWSPKGDEIAFVGNKAQQSDIYVYNVNTGAVRQITNDPFTDMQPVFSPDSKKIAFISDRGSYTDPQRIPKDFKMQNYPYTQRDLYIMDADGSNMVRVTDTPYGEDWPAWAPDGGAIAVCAEKTGISNIFIIDLKTKETRPLTNVLTGCFQLAWAKDGSKMVFTSFSNGGYDIYMIKNPLDIRSEDIKLENTVYFDRLKDQKKREEERAKPVALATQTAVSKTAPAKADLSRYVFDKNIKERSNATANATTPAAENETKSVYRTPEGEYLVKKYKLHFTPDLVMGNAGYNTYFGVQGQSTLLLSDVLGNHQILLGADLFYDLRNSSYYMQYLYLPRRTDYGFMAYHMANFFYSYGANFGYPVDVPFRLQQYGFKAILSRPFSKFSRVEFDLGYDKVSQTFLDQFSFFPSTSVQILRPSISIVRDNTLWTQGNWGPTDGTRVNLTFSASPNLGRNSFTFNTVMLDYRRYHKIRKDYSFDYRINTGASFGKNPEAFFVGGVSNWLNYEYKGTIRNQLQDIFFSYWITPLRGSGYWSLVGDRFALINTEFRFPLLKYLVLGWPLPIGFQNLRGSFFWDVGSAWTGNDFKFKAPDPNDGKDRFRDVATGYGVGVSIPFYLLIRFNMAWTYDGLGNSKPHYLFSLGYDF